jgi:hypothetical protein
MPLGFPPEALASGVGYVPMDSDIFVVSYPKCGTTWLQYIVYLLIRRRPLRAADVLTDDFPHLEEVGSSCVEAQADPRLIKTHLRFEMTPFSPGAHYLFIARNPFDCAVSFFHHTRGFPRHYDFSDGSFSEYFECFLAGEVDFGGYFEHFRSWYRQRTLDNVLFLTYEALTNDPKRVIRRIARFLGSRALASIRTESDLDALIDESSLSSMRRDQQRWSSARPDWAPAFVRSGKVGGWPAHFTPGQARALLAEFEVQLADAGIENPWPEAIAQARAYADGAASPTNGIAGETNGPTNQD